MLLQISADFDLTRSGQCKFFNVKTLKGFEMSC